MSESQERYEDEWSDVVVTRADGAPPPPGPETRTRTEGPTPAGGAYAIAYWRDADGNPCPRDGAAAVEIVEFDAADQAIARTYADLKPREPFSAKDDGAEA